MQLICFSIVFPSHLITSFICSFLYFLTAYLLPVTLISSPYSLSLLFPFLQINWASATSCAWAVPPAPLTLPVSLMEAHMPGRFVKFKDQVEMDRARDY